jgi:hypothetical protein
LVKVSGAFNPVAKEKMICPFSNRICEECPLYRGRHYYLCFNQKYRGYLGKPGKGTKEDVRPHSGAGSKTKFEIPSKIAVKVFDPFAADRESHQEKEDE